LVDRGRCVGRGVGFGKAAVVNAAFTVHRM
jgi:hypothetical protein